MNQPAATIHTCDVQKHMCKLSTIEKVTDYIQFQLCVEAYMRKDDYERIFDKCLSGRSLVQCYISSGREERESEVDQYTYTLCRYDVKDKRYRSR